MFLVNRLLGTNKPKVGAEELTVIDQGRLYLVRPDSLKAGRECIFIDASISIRRTTYEHTYQLVVTRTFQEGEEQLLEEDAENSDERAFLIDENLFLSVGPTLDPSAATPPPFSITWADPEGDGPEDEFEFVLAPAPDITALAHEFERLVWRCLWEDKTNRTWPTDAREVAMIEENELQQFMIERTAPQTLPASTKQPLFRSATPESDSDAEDFRPPPPSARKLTTADLDDSNDERYDDSDDERNQLAATLMKKATLTPSSTAKGKVKATSAPASAAPTPSRTKSKAKEPIETVTEQPPKRSTPGGVVKQALVSVEGDLYLYDRATGMFMMQEPLVQASIHRTMEAYWLIVEGKTGPWVSQGIDSETTFSEAEKSMVFNYRSEPEDGLGEGESSQVYTWLVRFPTSKPFEIIQQAVTTALFEDKFGSGTWQKLKEDEQAYQRRAYIDDAEMFDAVNEEEEGQGQSQEEVDELDEEEEEGEEGENDDERPKFGEGTQTKNSQLAVGYKDALSFVVQGDMIGVFKQQHDGGKKLKFVTSIVNISTPDGKKAFTPQKVMLHNQDTSMILQNPLAPGSLYRLDLTTGQVVDEYKVSDEVQVKSFLPDSKFAQTTQQQTFIGLSHNSVFRIDPRLSGSKLVNDEFKQYVTKNDFSVATTTESGRLAVASNKGDIRLFDKLGKNAKTALPALGDPILGIDVTADGRWVLATCRTYLLLIDTQIPEGAGRYGGSSGFDRSFPAGQKPMPKRLQLKPEHVAYMQEQSREGVSFTPAKFNAGLGADERTIVTSTGPYIVAWNFRQVKQGNVANYTLRRFSDTIVADSFKFGGDREIIAMLPNDVFVEDKKKLKAPNRDSISSVVKSYYD
ncbi:BQ5605_C004g02710 [Microbotryum silenes-dioicae]|uniref:BQ5605_C004g02710 protein n=1 Tax=Microbotryum silenes-dioicae TaxID=796604 RepID=A0A2X0M8H8_9BASI|nr:BQ5605_C004g02710 [Microbotryum silenes-dioicae]